MWWKKEMRKMDNKKYTMIRNLQLKGYFKMSVLYLLIYLVVIVIASVYYAYQSGLSAVSFQVDTFAIVTKIFLLVLGVVNFTITFKDYIVQGATRKEYLLGTLSAIALLALSFTALLTIIYLTSGFISGQSIDIGDTLILMIASLLLYYTYFILGWFMGMCFVKYRVIGGVIAVLVSAAVIAVMEVTTSVGFVSLVGELDMTTPMSIPLVYNLLSTIIVSFLVTYYVYAKTKKIYFKL